MGWFFLKLVLFMLTPENCIAFDKRYVQSSPEKVLHLSEDNSSWQCGFPEFISDTAVIHRSHPGNLDRIFPQFERECCSELFCLVCA